MWWTILGHVIIESHLRRHLNITFRLCLSSKWNVLGDINVSTVNALGMFVLWQGLLPQHCTINIQFNYYNSFASLIFYLAIGHVSLTWVILDRGESGTDTPLFSFTYFRHLSIYSLTKDSQYYRRHLAFSADPQGHLPCHRLSLSTDGLPACVRLGCHHALELPMYWL